MKSTVNDLDNTDLSFFLKNKIRALCKKDVGQMKSILKFSSINFFRISCLDIKIE